MFRNLVWAVALGVCLALPGLAPTLWLAGATMIPMGFTIMAFMITGNTMLQLNARPEARGRVMALYGIVFLGSTPIGAPLVGWLSQAYDPRAALLLAGVAGLAAAWAAHASFARLSRRRESRESAVSPA